MKPDLLFVVLLIACVGILVIILRSSRRSYKISKDDAPRKHVKSEVFDLVLGDLPSIEVKDYKTKK